MKLHIEINQKISSSLSCSLIETEVNNYFITQMSITPCSVTRLVVLPEHVNYIRVCELDDDKYNFKPLKFPSENLDVLYYVYQLSEDPSQVESLGDEDDVPASSHWTLPTTEFEGLWESLIYEDDVKNELVKYVKTALLYSTFNVSHQIVTWNSIVLLHGPPGTGKTSLCKALAQKLSIRLTSQYPNGQLIEINTHSLFSKWFSESGKLVLKMFNKIKEWANDTNSFVCILIDEVESLTHARHTALNGTEPSDSIRVVNAVLTQIDQLKRCPNVLILATSNITEAIDIAFADRADIKWFIGYPSKWAAYEILLSCINELIKTGLVIGKCEDVLEVGLLKEQLRSQILSPNALETEQLVRSKILCNIAVICQGLSGRTLRKLPFLASTKFEGKSMPTLTDFMQAMADVSVKFLTDQNQFFCKDSNKKA